MANTEPQPFTPGETVHVGLTNTVSLRATAHLAVLFAVDQSTLSDASPVYAFHDSVRATSLSAPV